MHDPDPYDELDAQKAEAERLGRIFYTSALILLVLAIAAFGIWRLATRGDEQNNRPANTAQSAAPVKSDSNDENFDDARRAADLLQVDPRGIAQPDLHKGIKRQLNDLDQALTDRERQMQEALREAEPK